MDALINMYEVEKICEYKGETYSVRDNGSIMRHPKNVSKPRALDNIWTFGKINKQKGYLMLSSEAVHRIVAVAFLGVPPTNNHVIDHIDTNRQNNRPTNLRWVTRLENILLNEITRKKLELLCGCSIDKILSDISILRDKPLTPEFKWMKVVTDEEAKSTLKSWEKWLQKSNKEINLSSNKLHTPNMKKVYRNKNQDSMKYPLEPEQSKNTLDDYFNALKKDIIFCYKNYYDNVGEFIIIDFYLNKNTGILSVATTTNSKSSVKPFYITEVTLQDNKFYYDTRSFFLPDGIEKYMTIARDEEWTGGDVFDDFC